MSSFSAGMAPAEKADHGDQYKAELHEELAAVEPVDGVAL